MGFLFVYEDSQQRIAQEDECADDFRVPASGLVLEPAGILAPVVSVFDSAPMSPDSAAPLFRRALLAGQAAEVVAEYGFTGVGFGASEALYDQQRACIREAQSCGVDFLQGDAAAFYTSVSAFGLVKKGEATAAAVCA